MGAATHRYWSDWGTRLGLVGDLIVFDYRGTGESGPMLGCESRSATLAAGWDEEPTDPRDTSGLVAALRECAAEAVQSGQTLENLSTQRNANDAVAILTALAYERWDLYAVSYGTVVAQRILGTNPTQLSRVILDSPPPPGRSAELTVLAWARVPDVLNEFCGYVDCREGRSSDLRRALMRLRREPHRFDSQAIGARLIVDDFRFLQAVVDALSDRYTRREVPWIVGAAAEGDYGGLETLVELFLEAQSTTSANDLVYWATECRDFGQINSAAFEGLVTEHSFVQPYISGLGCPLDLTVASIASDSREARHPIEALVLSPRFDPISPVAVGRDLAATMKGVQLVFDNASHGVAYDDDPCVSAVISQFVRTGHVTEIRACEPQPSSP
jgi:pimeloyl-ACP methyl ester carboxylesterase